MTIHHHILYHNLFIFTFQHPARGGPFVHLSRLRRYCSYDQTEKHKTQTISILMISPSFGEMLYSSAFQSRSEMKKKQNRTVFFFLFCFPIFWSSFCISKRSNFKASFKFNSDRILWKFMKSWTQRIVKSFNGSTGRPRAYLTCLPPDLGEFNIWPLVIPPRCPLNWRLTFVHLPT